MGSNADRNIKPPFAYIGAGDTYEIVDAPVKPTEPITTYRGKLYREVKRKAKVGELVKIVNKWLSCGKYENGDILTCKETFGHTSILAGELHGPCVNDSEYVVLEPIAPVKRVYTAEQIQEARDIVYRIIAECTLSGIAYAFVRLGNKTLCRQLSSVGAKIWHEIKCVRAECLDTDTWNDDVGRCVALCKLTGEKLPKWVRNE